MVAMKVMKVMKAMKAIKAMKDMKANKKVSVSMDKLISAATGASSSTRCPAAAVVAAAVAAHGVLKEGLHSKRLPESAGHALRKAKVNLCTSTTEWHNFNGMDRLLAFLAKESYEPEPRRNFKNFDRFLTNKNATMWSGTVDGKKWMIVACRGTDFKNADDVLNDVDILVNNEPKRRVEALHPLVQEQKEKQKPDKIVFTGHSLGGSVAAGLAKLQGNTNNVVVVFNPGAGLNLRDGTDPESQYDSIKKIVKCHRIREDVVSVLWNIGTVHHYNTRPHCGAHDVANFVFPEDEIDFDADRSRNRSRSRSRSRSRERRHRA